MYHVRYLSLLIALVALSLSASSVSLVGYPGLQAAGGVGTLILNEISPRPSNGEVWVELINPTEGSAALSGWSIAFMSGTSIAFPADSPDCPPGGLVLVTFGPGAAEPLLVGSTVNIRIPNMAEIASDGDGCILSGPDGAVDAITWGHPPIGIDMPLSPGQPLWPEYEVLMDDEPLFHADDMCMRIAGTWPPSVDKWLGSDNWAYRSGDSASPGRPNPPPAALFLSPEDGERIASDFYLTAGGLDRAGPVTFQVARDRDFVDVVIERTVDGDSLLIDALAEGTYYWRVKGNTSDPGGWSDAREFTVLPFDIDELISAAQGQAATSGSSEIHLAAHKGGGQPPGFAVIGDQTVTSWHVIGCVHRQQRKDTGMLCLDRCSQNGQYDSWDAEHPVGPVMVGGHKNKYCVRACLAMIAALGGCTLSQDRISFHIFQELGETMRDARELGHLEDPFKDLGHGVGVWDSSALLCLDWIYSRPAGSAYTASYDPDLFNDFDTSDMDTLVEFINDDRPVIQIVGRHDTLIDGYIVALEGGVEERFIHVLDPYNVDDVAWLSLITRPRNMWFTFPPATGRPSVCDEPEIKMDSDSDGIVDFDEINRLETDPNNVDTDGDGLNDKIDMYGYLFDRHGTYSLRDRDIDADGAAKELDPDNDRAGNNGEPDGCEDRDWDGFTAEDGTESSNFVPSDDFSILNPICYSGIIRLDGAAVIPGASLLVSELLVIEAGQISSPDYVHPFHWSIQSTPIIVAPGRGIVVAGQISGEGDGRGRVTLEVDESGHYRLVTDVQPQQMTYLITTNVRQTTGSFFLGLADHHFEYLPPNVPAEVRQMVEATAHVNIFEGQVETTDSGGARIAGEDFITIPTLGEASGGTARTWEILISAPTNP